MDTIYSTKEAAARLKLSPAHIVRRYWKVANYRVSDWA